MKFVIIGNSAAGLSAAENIRKLRRDADIAIIGKEPHTAYLRCMLKYVLSGEKDIKEIYYKKGDFYNKFDLKTYLGIAAKLVLPKEKKVILNDETEVCYDKLLVAAGASNIPLGIENETARNIFYFRKYDDAKRCFYAAEKAETAVVIGAGPAGIGASEALTKKGIKVTVIEKASHILPEKSDKKTSEIIEKSLSEKGINFIFETKPKAFVCDKNILKSVIIENGCEIPVDIALITTGAKASDNLLKNIASTKETGISVNNFLETSVEDVFAAGDCIGLVDSVTEEPFRSACWHYAVEQGRYAAWNMAGKPKKYRFPIKNMTSGSFGDIPFISVGAINKDSESSTYKNGRNIRRFFIKNNRLIGYILTGDVNGAGIYTSLIKRKYPIDKRDFIKTYAK